MSQADELAELKREKLLRLYRAEPEAYARDVLGVTWWDAQIRIARAVAEGQRKVAVPACHGIGKSFLMGGLVNWHFDCFRPGLTLTTAPTEKQVIDVLWKEVRTQRRGRPGLLPKAPRLETSAAHFAAGYTARDANAFQGRHEERGIILFDEAVGIDGQFFDAVEGIISGGAWVWVCIYNPTDTGSRMYVEELSGDWHIERVSALDHPNIIAGLRNEPEPFPGAVSLAWVEERLRRWCTFVGGSQYKKPGDFEYPPGSGLYYRPGPLFESRVLGRWPSQGFDTVWSEVLFESTMIPQDVQQEPTKIGCDVARFGDDYTTMHVRRGSVSLHHERHNGWGTDETAGRLKQLAKEFAQEGEAPTTIEIYVDDDGVGGGVYDQRGDYNFIGISAAAVAIEPEDYPNRRSELWFTVAKRAEEGRVDFSRLSTEHRTLLRRQFLTPKWKVDGQGRRVVEPKADMKSRLKKQNPQLEGGSPDDADAVNLAYCGGRPVRGGGSVAHVAVTSAVQSYAALGGLGIQDNPYGYNPFQ